MNTAIGCLVVLAAVVAATSARAQLVVPSYQRTQPFVFCDDVPRGEELSVPFDLINRGTLPITIDSAVAVGDTADFYSNYLIGSSATYMNPVMWKYINEKVMYPGDIYFSSFFFAPKTPGTKNLAVTVYYHDTAGAHTTVATMRYFTVNGPRGLGFLRTASDTITYADSIGFTSVTYDRDVVQDSVVIEDTIRVGDTLRAVMVGEGRLDLSSCGSATITSISTTQSVAEDVFSILGPMTPKPLNSGDSTLVNFIYVARSTEETYRAAEATFTSTAGTVRLKLRLVTDFSSDVKPEGPGDERGLVVITTPTLASAPNPFAASTTLRVAVPRAAEARLQVLDAVGREVAVVFDGTLDAGTHELAFDAAGLAPGLYFARLTLDGVTRTHRLMVVR